MKFLYAISVLVVSIVFADIVFAAAGSVELTGLGGYVSFSLYDEGYISYIMSSEDPMTVYVAKDLCTSIECTYYPSISSIAPSTNIQWKTTYYQTGDTQTKLFIQNFNLVSNHINYTYSNSEYTLFSRLTTYFSETMSLGILASLVVAFVVVIILMVYAIYLCCREIIRTKHLTERQSDDQVIFIDRSDATFPEESKVV